MNSFLHDRRVFEIYDEYCHGRIDRRESKIKAAVLAHLVENDARINEMYPAFAEALEAAGVRHEIHVYAGTQHGFHNNSTPRYNEQAAKLAWERTVAHFRKYLA